MILPGTYANGFAPRDGEPLFPELWDGCVGAWNPGLGPTGLTLRDWSPYKNHGTLTNGPSFSPRAGRYAITYDATDDYVDCGTSTLHQFGTASNFSVSCWFLANATAGERGLVTRVNSSDQGWALTVSSGNLRFPAWNAGPSVAIATNTIYHACAVNRAGTREVWLNGVLAASSATGNITSNSINVVLGRYYGNFAGFVLDGWTDNSMIHNRAIGSNEIRLLASRRGIAYEMAPRSWTLQQIAAYRARYYSQVIGSGVV